jgi:hypothetical protein
MRGLDASWSLCERDERFLAGVTVNCCVVTVGVGTNIIASGTETSRRGGNDCVLTTPHISMLGKVGVASGDASQIWRE